MKTGPFMYISVHSKVLYKMLGNTFMDIFMKNQLQTNFFVAFVKFLVKSLLSISFLSTAT